MPSGRPFNENLIYYYQYTAVQKNKKEGCLMSFGKNLQHLRRMCGNITQETLAEKLIVSRQTISKWELDESTPEMDKAIELCGLFNCSLDNLFRIRR